MVLKKSMICPCGSKEEHGMSINSDRDLGRNNNAGGKMGQDSQFKKGRYFIVESYQ